MLFQFQLIPTNGKIKITNQTAKLSIKISGEEQEDELKQSMPRDYFKFKVSIQKPNNLLTKKKKKAMKFTTEVVLKLGFVDGCQ